MPGKSRSLAHILTRTEGLTHDGNHFSRVVPVVASMHQRGPAPFREEDGVDREKRPNRSRGFHHDRIRSHRRSQELPNDFRVNLWMCVTGNVATVLDGHATGAGQALQ